ncbi:MAG TPA: hypothetical protein VFT70_10955 [Nocardioides sp.]|nr:hypothetical protein [Nocardioides sp.]
MDLADAEQASCRPSPQAEYRAAELYASSDAHRRRAERLEAGDRSALLEIEAPQPAPSNG